MGIHWTGTGQATQILDILLKPWKFGSQADVKVAIVLVAFTAVKARSSV
jgi:hypothetical protein